MRYHDLQEKPSSPFSTETLQNKPTASADPRRQVSSDVLNKLSDTAPKPIASKKLVRDRSMSRTLSDRQSAESVERSSLSQSSATSREGKLESKLKGWTTGRLNRGAEGTADSSSGNDTDREARKERRVRVEERKADGPPSSSRDAAGMNFSERMSSMFAAASNTLRPSSAKRDEPQRYNLICAKHRTQSGKLYGMHCQAVSIAP